MIVQSTPIVLKQRNRPNRECLYAWYPEAVSEEARAAQMGPREIYMHKGIDKDLLQQSSSTTRVVNNSYDNINDDAVVQRYKQSTAASERIYQSIETLDEALKTPWALHYEVKRRPATPNFPSNSTNVPIREEIPRRLKSAPLVRPLPTTTVITIPEPRFVTPLIPVPINQVPQTASIARPKSRASSAKARLNTTFPGGNNEQMYDDLKQQRREIKSAQLIRTKDEPKLPDEENQKTTIQVYTDTIQPQESLPPPPPTPPPAYAYQKSVSWSATEPPSTPTNTKPLRGTIEINSVSLNPYYIHRPGVISVRNSDKKPVIREGSASRRSSSKHHRRHHHHYHHREKRQEPLLALTPIPQSHKTPFELDGINLTYDPTISIDDPSLNLTRYFIEGRLYLIKDQSYNVLENIDQAFIDKYNQTSTGLPQRPKYYQTIPLEKFQIPKPAADIHYKASDTYFYNTLPKRVHRYIIDPHFISENLNVNRMSLSKRPSTAAASSTIHRPPTATVYA